MTSATTQEIEDKYRPVYIKPNRRADLKLVSPASESDEASLEAPKPGPSQKQKIANEAAANLQTRADLRKFDAEQFNPQPSPSYHPELTPAQILALKRRGFEVQDNIVYDPKLRALQPQEVQDLLSDFSSKVNWRRQHLEAA